MVGEMAPLCRFEPEGSELLAADQETTQFIDRAEWGKFFDSFSGHNIEVTRRFSLSLKGRVAQIGDLQLVLSEDFIAQATELPRTGEKWFKKGKVNKTKWKQFLLPLPGDFDDTFGFPVKLLKPQWMPLFRLIVRCRS